MANAWGDAWGTSWGDAWGEVELVWLDVSAASSIWTDPEPQQATLTLTRASTAFQYDGISYSQLATNALRDDHSVTANDGNTYTTTLLEDEQENLVLRSSEVNPDTAEWAASSADFTWEPALSAIPGATARLFSTASTSRRFSQDLGTLTAAPETVYVIAEALGALFTDIVIWDGGASDRVSFARLDWSDLSASQVDNTAGVDTSEGVVSLGTGPNGGDMALLWTTGTPANPGNVRQIRCYPCGAPTPPSSVSTIVHHIQHVEAAAPSSPIITTTSSATRKADDASDDFTPPPQEMTVYVEMVDLGTAALAGASILHIGAASASADPRFNINVSGSGTQYEANHDNGTSTVFAGSGGVGSFGDRVELRAVLGSDGSVDIEHSLNGGDETQGAASGANALQGAWADTKIWLNSNVLATDVVGFAAFSRVVILAGTKSRAECRAADQGSDDVLWIYDNTPVTWSASGASTTWTDA